MNTYATTLKRLLIALWPALFLAAVMFAVFFMTLVIHNRTFYVFPDNIDQFYAWYQKLAQAVHHGTLPIWDANVSAGHSFVGELQAGVFYPINLIWVALFGSSQGISIFWLEFIVVFHFWLASLGMYYAARSLGMGKIGSLGAGLAFAVGGGVAVRSVSQTAIFFGTCLIPWAFFWFNKYLTGGKKLHLLWCAVALGFIIVAGHIDPWYFACLLMTFLVLFRPVHPSFEPWLRTTAKRLVALGIAVAASLVVALPQIALSAQYLPQAVRFVGDNQPIGPGQKVSMTTFIKTFSFTPQDTLALLDPVQYPVVDGNEVYVGLVGLGIVVGAVVLCRNRLRAYAAWRLYGRFVIGASAVAAIIMIGYWTFIPAVLRELPLFSQVRQLARYSVIIQFCLAMVVGMGIEVLSQGLSGQLRSRKRLLAGFGLAGFLALNSGYLYFLSRHDGAIDKHFAYQSAIVTMTLIGCLLLRNKLKYVLLAGMVLSSIVQPVWFMPRLSDFKPTYAPNYYQRTPVIGYLEQFYGKARVLIEDNALPVNIGDVYHIQTVGGYGATLHEPFYRFLIEPDAAGQAGRHMDLLNVRFLVSKKAHPELTKVFTDPQRHLFVYERPNYVPRAYFAGQLDACLAHAPDCTPPATTKYDDTHMTLTYQSDRPQQLVLSEVNYDGWQAAIDGKATPVASYGPTPVKLFRAVQVPAGKHTVEFRYKPLGL